MAETVTLQGTLGPTYDKEKMSRKSHYVFVCNKQNGLQVFYLPDKSLNDNYRFAATYTPDADAWAEDIIVAGNYGFLTWWKYDPSFDRDCYVSVLDITDPLNITLLGTESLGIGFVDRVVKDRQYLFVTSDDYVRVIDVSTPSNPTEVGSVQLSDRGWGMSF